MVIFSLAPPQGPLPFIPDPHVRPFLDSTPGRPLMHRLKPKLISMPHSSSLQWTAQSPTWLTKLGPHQGYFLTFTSLSPCGCKFLLIQVVSPDAFSNLQTCMKGPSYAPTPPCALSQLSSPRALRAWSSSIEWDSWAHPRHQYYLRKGILGCVGMSLHCIL